MIQADQLVAHLVGDYIFQSDWMAREKTKSLNIALTHALSYSVAFLALSPSWRAWTVIVLTHALIDRYRLARYVVWAKEWLSPVRPPPLQDCPTGYSADKPPYLAVWLFILADNAMHILINGLALKYL